MCASYDVESRRCGCHVNQMMRYRPANRVAVLRHLQPLSPLSFEASVLLISGELIAAHAVFINCCFNWKLLTANFFKLQVSELKPFKRLEVSDSLNSERSGTILNNLERFRFCLSSAHRWALRLIRHMPLRRWLPEIRRFSVILITSLKLL